MTSAPIYDELNRMIDKRLHASNYNGTSAVSLSSTFNYLQSVDYSYNIRGWLTGINDVTTCTTQSGDNLGDMFKMALTYESTATGGAAQYNGNISTMQWSTSVNTTTCSNRSLYRFSYDAANRLTAAAYLIWTGGWNAVNYYTESGVKYDMNSNLKSYTRQGLMSSAPNTFGLIDQLTYTYGDALRPDRLTQMADAGSITKGFKPGSGLTGDHYLYDANGNMTQDKHKNFVISYNHLNLPNNFAKGANFIIMTYTADGEKLTKAFTFGGTTKNYVGGIEYSAANLEAIYHGEGRLTPNGSNFFYEYTLKDHLGNARINFKANGAGVAFIEEHHYYPFGMKMEGIGSATVTNKYTYNSKELNDDLELNLHDYGARWYDAAVGRWWSKDPLTERTVNSSTYIYGFNNPLRYIDPNGMMSEAYGFLSKSQEISGKHEQFKREEEEYRKEKDKGQVNMTVTDEVVGTGYIYAGGQTGTDQYFEVNLYKMTVEIIDPEGKVETADFTVLKYGVKLDEATDQYYYQGFGNFSSLEEDLVIKNPSYDDHYKYGGFNLYKGGIYDLHPQHTAIEEIPDLIGGRANYGCIGVCGKGTEGWGGLTDLMFTAAGMTEQVGASQKNKKSYLASMLTRLDVTITIKPFTIPQGTPVPINK